MTRSPLVAAILAMASQALAFTSRVPQQHARTSNKGMRNKEGLPAGYPGAKLARKAHRGQITKRAV